MTAASGRRSNGRAANGGAVKGRAGNGGAANGRSRRGRSTNGADHPEVEPIAIVGIRGRFPGADDLETFWANLAEGRETITALSAEEVRAAGVPDHVARLPGFVRVAPVLDDVDRFDAGFFGMSARDATLTDPQHRLFLETAWEALEDAGYDPGAYPGAIGVFGGCELSSYLYQLYLNIDTLGYLDGMQLMVTNDKDHLCTQVSYRLNLRGPSMTVQTTCSTSLVAVAMACESLHAGTADMALAGGVTVRVPQRAGYFFTAGSILSPDGHCRPFDARAQGTVVGSGVGIVVLKKLSDALADGDQVRAVIRGVGINNDGSAKAGYTAPSPSGQVAAIRAAYDMAGVSADTIGMVEAHGTGTILGDPIEVSALTEVFRGDTERRGFCAIGSVKSNVGHLSCAAGVTGLIKAVLAIEHGAIPPTVHFQSPNPGIDFVQSPFYVTTELHPWDRNGTPRRAGVSSFGVGGTNAHLLVEEAPATDAPDKARPHQALTISARTETALDRATEQLADHLNGHPAVGIADVAFTLHVGRRSFPHRRAVVVGVGDGNAVVGASADHAVVGASADHAEAAAALRRTVGAATQPVVGDRRVVFMFTGQGSQYPGMLAGVHRSEPVVRRIVSRCARFLEPELGVDLRKLLFPARRRHDEAAATLRDTAFTQPALFTVEYALAELWRSWGVEPAAMIGHSIGEYVAAVVAGVMSLEDGLRLVARRGRLMSELPPGSMIGVLAPATDVAHLLDDDVSLAAVNAPDLCVLSGRTEAITRVERTLEQASIPARRLHTSHAFHSSMMEPILEPFEELLSDVELVRPSIPFVTNLDGSWAADSVTSPSAWSSQLRSPVRFAEGLAAVNASDGPAGQGAVLLEVGPGRTLVGFAERSAPGTAMPSLPGPEDPSPDTAVLMETLGRMWSRGVPIDWGGVHRTEPRRRVSLPTYPFERERYWVGTTPTSAEEPAPEARSTVDWFRRPVWREEALPSADDGRLVGQPVLVLDEATGLGEAVTAELRRRGASPIVARPAAAPFSAGSDGELSLRPGDGDDFRRLAAAACSGTERLAGVIDCWTATPVAEPCPLDEAVQRSFLTPARLVDALGNYATVRPLPLLLVARGVRRLRDEDRVDPPRALGLGSARVLPQEHPGIRVTHVDVDDDPAVAAALVDELVATAAQPSLALRDGRRLVERFEAAPIPDIGSPRLPDRPVCIVTGGLGYLGLIVAEALVSELNARLVLVGRSAVPDPAQWAALSESPSTPAVLRERCRSLLALQETGAELMCVSADLNDAAQVASLVEATVARFGGIDLVVHGAAALDPMTFQPAAQLTTSVVEAHLSPKVRGLLNLLEALRDQRPRWVLQSSMAAVLGGLTLSPYSVANSMVDAIAAQQGDGWLSINWDVWDNAGEAGTAAVPEAIRPDEGRDAFLRLLGADAGTRIVVSTFDLDARVRNWVELAGQPTGPASDEERHPRPTLSVPYIAPATATEAALAEIWAQQLGLMEVGAEDRFLDLGGHSLLAVQIAAQIRDRFQIEMPVAQLFQAPTVTEMAGVVDLATARELGGEAGNGQTADPGTPRDAAVTQPAVAAAPAEPADVDDPAAATKAGHRRFYDDVTRQLDQSGVADASFFLNYGYISHGDGDEATAEVPEGVFNAASVRLAYELVGGTAIAGRRVLDVGCGRGGTVALLAEGLGAAEAVGVDLSPEAVEFCRRTHRHPAARFEVGDAEQLPFDAAAFDVVTNMESSHTYPNLRAFLSEVARVLVPGGEFLHTDLLPIERWLEVRVLLDQLGLALRDDRDITVNVLTSCDQVAAARTGAFVERSAAMDNFLAVPGSVVYEQMRSAAWEYRILRSTLAD